MVHYWFSFENRSIYLHNDSGNENSYSTFTYNRHEGEYIQNVYRDNTYSNVFN